MGTSEIAKEAASQVAGCRPRRYRDVTMAGNKYNVSPKEERTWNGRVYDSKAECSYAMVLDYLRKIGDIIEFIEQPHVTLGHHTNVYRPDFFVVPNPEQIEEGPYYVDVKGHETKEFKRHKRLWAQYGRLDLVVVRKVGPGKFKAIETVKGGASEAA